MDVEACVALQYTTTDGYRPLKEYIAERYRNWLGLLATADEIQIVNSSQQSPDLFAKSFLDADDPVGMEQPGYLGAIEAFSLYEPAIHTVLLGDEGRDLPALRTLMNTTPLKFFFRIPNSQNPSGRTYSQENRKAVAEILDGTSTVFYQDDAFGELFFDALPLAPVKRYLPDQAVISGSFSTIVAPRMRIGWLYAPREIITQFNVAKQAADLHSNFLSQKILCRYLTTHDLDTHIRKITTIYAKKCRLMGDLFQELLPHINHTCPEGGMFLMATLPSRLTSRKGIRGGYTPEHSCPAGHAIL